MALEIEGVVDRGMRCVSTRMERLPRPAGRAISCSSPPP